ncbi:type II toxin-antitoxin system Phd/YefM family antitoxin [bacterium]|nr:MAG: type II toxin-antitoxin system Phd/YefM family antitoxin [bacterium]
MTIMTIRTNTKRVGTQRDGLWPVAVAKARLSELIERVLADGPQIITRKGRQAVVVVSIEEWERKSKRRGNLAEFLGASPLRGADIGIERIKDAPRELEL